MHRRHVLCGSAALVSVAGCLSDDGTGDGEDDPEVERGEIEIRIDEEPIDLEAERFQAEHADESVDFHFHEFDEYWYMEGEERITFATAIDHIPHFSYAHDGGEHVLTYDDATYDTSDPETTISFVRNDESVDPTEQRLYNGDELLVDVRTDDGD